MSKNKKRFLSVILAIAMLCSIVSPVWADVPRSEEGYYALGNDTHKNVYLESITIADSNKIGLYVNESEEEKYGKDGALERETKKYLSTYLNNSGGYVDKDLNDDAGGDYIYLGWNGTNDLSNAITGLRLLKWDETEPPAYSVEDGIRWHLVKRAVEIRKKFLLEPSNPTYFTVENTDSAIDLNEGAGGDYIYMYYTKDPSYGPPISEVKFTEDDDINLNSYQDKIVRFGDHEWYDVNDGAGGDYIYLYTETDFQAVDIPKLRELLDAAEECWYDSEGHADSVLELAYNNGKATLEAWGDDKYYTEDTSMKERVDYDIRTLQNALGNMAVNETVGDADLSIVMQIKDKILLNGKQINSDAAPIIVDNRAMVPIRVLPALLGGTADWDEATRTVTLNMGGEVYSMTIDQPISNFGTSVVVRDNHVYVPIRYVAEKLGANVEWNAAAQQVLIEKWNEM